MGETAGEWVHQQLQKLIQVRPDLVAPAVDRAMKDDEAFRWAMVVGAYLDGQINLGKAAEVLGIHRLELQRLFVQKGIPIRVGAESREEAQAEAEAWTAWTSSQDNP